jgi:hypothetical protein
MPLLCRTATRKLREQELAFAGMQKAAAMTQQSADFRVLSFSVLCRIRPVSKVSPDR